MAVGYVVVINNDMDRYLTVADAARRLDRSIEQVRRYLREGRLAGRRIGQQWFIEETALASWRPFGGGGRLGEAMVAYEVKSMKTFETKRKDRLISEELFREITATGDEIRRESREF